MTLQACLIPFSTYTQNTVRILTLYNRYIAWNGIIAW